MSNDRLRYALTELADEALPVDLRDRTLRSSRRLGIRRTVAGSAATLILLGGSAGALLANPRQHTDPPPIAATLPNPRQLPGQAWPVPQAGGVETENPTFGRLFYLPPSTEGNDGPMASVPLSSWRPGTAPDELLDLPVQTALNTVAVSPDGQRVVWVEQEGLLFRSDLADPARIVVASSIDGSCWVPAWLPDSRRLGIALAVDSKQQQSGDSREYRTRFLELPRAKLSGDAPREGCFPLWSANGRVLAYTGFADGRAFVTEPANGTRRTVPGLGAGEKHETWGLTSIAPDGRMVALHVRQRETTASDDPGPIVVLDTRTGAQIDLPLDGRPLRQAYFQADGTLVARVSAGSATVLVLIGADGRKLDEVREPVELNGLRVISVTR
ncbi:hypothetical protein [Micromonospora yangpuensis]|uniref:WD40-like Beta Propeller Repeat n=1 Tax=Micromonospora yangpuensis TaxID=683228 RepID=A0A1C6TX50_9ACTN|nr:hypothetical protein [Micromonospora yangpuensis]GGM01564.1 hypothetical protein GCM10012279_18920 [Micromonospora yangpuensis]SCL46233.1 hypothetical protein GA0070617_0195 [Micromonospora yangpuensis]